MSTPNTTPPAAGSPTLKELVDLYRIDEQLIRAGGGKSAINRQHEKGRLTARERIELLLDGAPETAPDQLKGVLPSGGTARFQELGMWCAHGMYQEHGGAPSAGVVTGIGRVCGRTCMIIANDATVKAGAFFPMTCKKIIRAQTIAHAARMPLIYLVDSAGVFLPMQEDVFPDTDDFGRIFRNNAIISAEGIPQIAAIMGYCVAGGGYLPVLCDTLLMTEGSGLYLAGPALVKAAIGQDVTDEELGGAQMHAAVSGTIDFREKDDVACIARVRSLVSKYPLDDTARTYASLRDQMLEIAVANPDEKSRAVSEQAINKRFDEVAQLLMYGGFHPGRPALRDGQQIYSAYTDKSGAQYDVRDVIACIVDAKAGGTATALEADFDEYKPEYGQSIVCGYAKINGHACGIVANQKKLVRSGKGQTQMPGVIYDDSADKSARFIMDCNQRKVPIVFLHDTTGFMVGRDSEQGGIIRAGAKMVNAMANCVVPKIVVIIGGSYGAGNYAMCGRAFDQFISFAWPNAKCAVMGANQATGVLTMIEEASRKRKGETIDPETHKQIYGAIHAGYTEQADIRHGAARGWVDRLIEPQNTRAELSAALDACANWDYSRTFRTGVIQT
jgi:acetyl-CoA carboxylase carboxyltransferase component